jgi:acetyltransferase-like isoleucine patch superfamily enzyme
VKLRQHPVADLAWRLSSAARRAQVPVIPSLHRFLWHARGVVLLSWSETRRVFWWTPLLQSRLVRPARGLRVIGGLPLVSGPVDIEFGDNCTISGQVTISGRCVGTVRPRLVVGAGSEINWQTTISVGTRVELGQRVLVAGKCFLAGYPGHPTDPSARAAGMPDTDDQVGDIVLEDDVWLATGVTVLAGVRIGRGTVVGAGAVVTRDLPPGKVAVGVPARVVGDAVPAPRP